MDREGAAVSGGVTLVVDEFSVREAARIAACERLRALVMVHPSTVGWHADRPISRRELGSALADIMTVIGIEVGP